MFPMTRIAASLALLLSAASLAAAEGNGATPRSLLVQAKGLPADFEEHLFDVPLAVQVERDSLLVGEAMVVLTRDDRMTLLEFTDLPAYYMGEQNQKTAIMTKIGNVSIREWMSGEKFLPYIWLAGMILCLLFHAIQYRIWKKRIFAECKKMQKNSVLEALKKASEVCKIKKTEIWVCENQDFYSPMLFGVRNTKVLIPQEMLETENYSYEEWYLIFLHELTHQKKHDLWYKRFLQIIRDVYWFCIPMLWVQKMANIDIECVCDETVTKHMNLTQRKDYCNVILKVASKQTKKELSGVVSMVSETEILKERFYNVFLARKKLRIYVTVFLFGIIILSFSEMQIARQIWSSSHIENCPKCKAAVQGEVVWNAWENEKNVVCTHQYAWGDDLQKARYGVEKIRCNECGNFFEIKIRQEKIVCHGYND